MTILHKLPNVKAVVVYNIDKIPNDVNEKRAYTWNDFLKLGKEVKDDEIIDKVAR